MFAKLKKPMPAMICRNGTFFASMRSSSLHRRRLLLARA